MKCPTIIFNTWNQISTSIPIAGFAKRGSSDERRIWAFIAGNIRHFPIQVKVSLRPDVCFAGLRLLPILRQEVPKRVRESSASAGLEVHSPGLVPPSLLHFLNNR